MEPAEPVGGRAVASGGAYHLHEWRGEAQRRAPQSLTPRGEKGRRNANCTCFLASPPGGGASSPPAWRERASGDPESSRRTPHSHRCAAPRLTPGAAARPLVPRRLRLPACSAPSAAPPAQGRGPGAAGGRAWPCERPPPSSGPARGEVGTRGRWRPPSASVRLLARVC